MPSPSSTVLARLGALAAPVLALALGLPLTLVPAGAQAATTANAPGPHWQTAWATAQQPVSRLAATPAFNRSPDLAGRTLRQIVQVRVSGHEWRLRLANRYGDTPVTITAASLARAGKGAAVAATPTRVTFGGAQTVTLAPGESRDSDPVPLDMTSGAVAVSLAVAHNTGAPGTWHKVASQVAFVSTPGDHTLDTNAGAFHAGTTAWLFVDGLDVDTARLPHVVVAIGDSITDGMRSSLNGNARWPDVLGERFAHEAPGADISVVNLGISGNRLLSDSPCYGQRLLGRFDHDALQVRGVRDVVVLIGINDINFQAMPRRSGLDCDAPHTHVTAANLIEGYQQLIAHARRAGVRIDGATLTPASLPPDREAIRLAVNRWIRNSDSFDHVIDFDRVLKDPEHPDRMLRMYDSGDHVHPNDAGYRAMAESVPLTIFAN